MADPVTVACSVAQFLGLAGQALQGISWLRRRFRDIRAAPKLIQSIHDELLTLEKILAQLSTLEPSQISEHAAESFTETLNQCADVLDAFTNKILPYNFRKPEGGAKRLWKQVMVDDHRHEFDQHLKRLERTKSSLSITMEGLNVQMTADLSRRQAAEFSDVNQSLGRIESGISTISVLSGDIYTNTLELKGGQTQITDLISGVGQSVRNLQNDLPTLVERGLQKHFEGQMMAWLQEIAINRGQIKGPPCKRRDSFVEPFGGDMGDNQCEADQKVSRKDSTSASSAAQLGDMWQQKSQVQPLSTYSHRKKLGNDFPMRKKTYTQSFPLPFGFMQAKTTQRTCLTRPDHTASDDKEIIRIEITIIPFRWLSARGQTVTIEKVYNQFNGASWKYTPRSYNVVPDDAIVLLACYERDVEMVRKLFQYRKASPFDVNPDGLTLMAVSLDDCQNANSDVKPITKALEVIRFLISQGTDMTPFIREFLDAYKWFSGQYSILDKLDMITDELETVSILDEIWRLCLENCQSDPFTDTEVLEKLWNASLGGWCIPPLNSAYLFQENFAGFDDLVFENPDLIFSDILKKRTGMLGTGSEETWQMLLDQLYETLVYVCSGGESSIKAKVFKNTYWEKVPRQSDSCFCPESQSHLLFKVLHRADFSDGAASQRKPLRYHIHRLLTLLLQNGEAPEGTCNCKTAWQHPEGHRTVTDLAAKEGLLDVWETVLEETGYDAKDIIDSWRFEGFADLFERPQYSSSFVLRSAKFVGGSILSTLSCIV